MLPNTATPNPSRRKFLVATASAGIATAGLASAVLPSSPVVAEEPDGLGKSSIKIALNTSTIRGQELSVPDQIRVTADAGYDAMEPWIRDLRGYVDGGGKLTDLRRQLDDAGIGIAGAIGFAKWIVNDDAERAAGLDEARRDMEMVRTLGGTCIAAPPIGAHTPKDLETSGPIPLEVIASRYRDLLNVGAEMGVTPLLELWGFSPTISRLGELAYVATAAAHPLAAVLPDFYHIYKGGNEMSSLGMIEAARMPLFHINDYPAQPSQPEIADKDRVFPGDGICPLVETIAMLIRNGFAGTFSLELFNPSYWQREASEVAREGYEKSRAVIEQAQQA